MCTAYAERIALRGLALLLFVQAGTVVIAVGACTRLGRPATSGVAAPGENGEPAGRMAKSTANRAARERASIVRPSPVWKVKEKLTQPGDSVDATPGDSLFFFIYGVLHEVRSRIPTSRRSSAVPSLPPVRGHTGTCNNNPTGCATAATHARTSISPVLHRWGNTDPCSDPSRQTDRDRAG